MALEMILSKSDTSAKENFRYNFQAETSAKFAPYVRRALNESAAELYEGKVLLETKSGCIIYRIPTDGKKVTRMDVSYSQTGKKIEVSLQISVPVGSRDIKEVSREAVEIRPQIHALIDGWDKDIKLGKDGKFGTKLAEKLKYITGLEVNVSYSP